MLDLGASPGSWSEYLADILGKSGQLWALDLNPLSITAQEKLKKAGLTFQFLQQSIFDALPENDLPKFDAVVSDMAPLTQGSRLVDCARSLELSMRAFDVAKATLKRGGHFVVKVFHSEDAMLAAREWENSFKFGKLYRPPAVAKESKEIYFIGQNFKVE